MKVKAVPINELTETKKGETSEGIKSRVQIARKIQQKRFEESKVFCNSEMSTNDIKKFCEIQRDAQLLLEQAVQKLHLTARSYYRTLKVSRTIADLAQSESIQKAHIAESLQYRFSDSF